LEDVANLPGGPAHVVVDDLVLITVGQSELFAGLFQSALEGGFGFGAPAAKPLLQDRQGTGADEDRDCAGIAGDHGQCALHINI
jgi:hypothetical protein